MLQMIKGAVSYCHTLSIHDKNGNAVASSCSFKSIPMKKNRRCSVHRGKLVGFLENTETVVKVFPCSKEADAEMKKLDFMALVLKQCPSAAKAVQLVRTFQSEVDKVGRCFKKKNGEGAEGVQEGDRVLVQDYVDGDVHSLFCLTSSHTLSSCPAFLLELVAHSYSLSNGACVIAAIEGAVVSERGRPNVTYIVTSLTIHSRARKFGAEDLGVQGVQMYEPWIGHHSRLAPSAPPPSLTVGCGDSRYHPDASSSHAPSTSSWTRQSQPRRPSLEVWQRYGNPLSARQTPDCLDGHCVDSVDFRYVVDLNSTFDLKNLNPNCGPEDRRREGGGQPVCPTDSELLAAYPILRAQLPESLLNSILGPAPPYSSTVLS